MRRKTYVSDAKILECSAQSTSSRMSVVSRGRQSRKPDDASGDVGPPLDRACYSDTETYDYHLTNLATLRTCRRYNGWTRSTHCPVLPSTYRPREPETLGTPRRMKAECPLGGGIVRLQA